VNNKITPPKVRSTTPEEEVMEGEEDMKEEVDTEAEEPLVEEEDQSFVITMDNRVTSPETAPRLHVPIVKLPTMLSKTVQYY
jgi:hypothetical protein